MLLLDAADFVEHPLHRLGLHGPAWVTAFALIVMTVVAIAWWSLRLLSRRLRERERMATSRR